MMRALHWLEDAGRCIWALLYWNVRKSLYVFRGRSGRCPCQDPSDFGGKGGVHCEASRDLKNPLRFRRVCPLLVPGSYGRGAYCSVPANRVRPFWGRALLFFGAAFAVIYVAGVTTVFVGMRARGVDSLRWHQVAWPGLWKDVPRERSKYFFKRALQACARRDYQDAYRSMATALAEDPRNYDARLLMAQYAEFAGDFLTGDELFGRLMGEFPEARLRTAVTLHDTLLAAGRYGVLAGHCLRMAEADAAHRSTWVGSLLLAMHLGRIGPAFVTENDKALARLDTAARRLILAEARLAGGDAPAAVALLRGAFAPPVDGNYAIQQIRMFLRAGYPADAEMAWTVNTRGLDEFDRRLARCWVDHGLGYLTLSEMEFSSLADRVSTVPAALDKLVATLVMQPDRESFLQLHRSLLKTPAAPGVEVVAGMWLAALVCGADRERDYWARQSLERFRQVYPGVEAVNFRSVDATKNDTVPFLAGFAPFGRETVMSLYWRIEPPLAAAGDRLPK